MISFTNKTQHDNYLELQSSSVGTAVAPVPSTLLPECTSCKPAPLEDYTLLSSH